MHGSSNTYPLFCGNVWNDPGSSSSMIICSSLYVLMVAFLLRGGLLPGYDDSSSTALSSMLSPPVRWRRLVPALESWRTELEKVRLPLRFLLPVGLLTAIIILRVRPRPFRRSVVAASSSALPSGFFSASTVMQESVVCSEPCWRDCLISDSMVKICWGYVLRYVEKILWSLRRFGSPGSCSYCGILWFLELGQWLFDFSERAKNLWEPGRWELLFLDCRDVIIQNNYARRTISAYGTPDRGIVVGHYWHSQTRFGIIISWRLGPTMDMKHKCRPESIITASSWNIKARSLMTDSTTTTSKRHRHQPAVPYRYLQIHRSINNKQHNPGNIPKRF